MQLVVIVAYIIGGILVALAMRESITRLVESVEARRTRSFDPVTLDFTAYKLRERERA